MSRELTDELLEQMLSQQSNDPLLTLVTISHSSIGTPYRFVNNTENIISRGNTFNAFSFIVGLPNDDGEVQKQVTIQIDNTTLELITALRSITEPLTADVEYILASDPDTVQFSIEDLEVRAMTYNQSVINLTLSLDDIMNTPLTSESYDPATYRGLF